MHIIEKYLQVSLGCLTMTNVRCRGGKEIDLLAMNPKNHERFHIESRVTVTGFKVRKQDTYVSSGNRKGTPHKIGLDYFDKAKFEHAKVKEKVLNVFGPVLYRKVLVVWDVDEPSTIAYAKERYGIEIWLIQDMLSELGKHESGSRDDVMRLAELFYHSANNRNEENPNSTGQQS